MKTKDQQRLEYIIEYILEHEGEDFYSNPHDDHIYYHALALDYTEHIANRELTNAINLLNEKENN